MTRTTEAGRRPELGPDLGAALAARHAAALLGQFGLAAPAVVAADHPALAWRRAGLLAVTGDADGPGLVAPAALTAAADGALAALRSLAPDAALPANGAMLLGERARLLELGRRGAISPNGSCRLIAAADGRIALNLPRPDDWEAVPALLGEPAADWDALARIARTLPARRLLEQGRLLGLAVALDAPAPPAPAFRAARLGRGARRRAAPLVVDLSALWAGPLAGALLADAGAEVVKVESRTRPDGARFGDPAVFQLLNGAKRSLVLDFHDAGDRKRLRRLVADADIVIEGTRPRALAQLDIDSAAEAARGATWVSITGHGREGAAADWVGFGDDAAIAGGLGAAMQAAWGRPLFAGDAIADPLTGVTAAAAAYAGHATGGFWLVSLALSEVVANAVALHRPDAAAWQAMAEADDAALYPARIAAF